MVTGSDERGWTRMGIGEAAYAALAKVMAASDLWSLLLGVLEQRASQRTAALSASRSLCRACRLPLSLWSMTTTMACAS